MEKMIEVKGKMYSESTLERMIKEYTGGGQKDTRRPFGIYGQDTWQTAKVLLDLKKDNDGDVMLKAVDISGELISNGDIGYIGPDGIFHRFAGCVVPGIQTDEQGRIIVK